MKKMKPFLINIKKNFPGPVFAIILISIFLGGNVIAQDRRQDGGRREGNQGNRQGGDHHQNINRNNQVRPVTRPVNNARVNRVNTSVNRNTTVNRTTVINRTNRVTVNRSVNNSYRRPVYNARNPNWRYSNVPRRNTVIRVVPTTYRTINYGGFGYRYHNGIFYRPYNSTFVVVAPPIGLFINVLPIGYSRIYVHNYPYYYYNGTYYDYRDNNYTVVSPPVGAVVESLPDGYQTVTVDGETYYTVDGAQYKPVVQDNGEIWYEVIKAN